MRTYTIVICGIFLWFLVFIYSCNPKDDEKQTELNVPDKPIVKTFDPLRDMILFDQFRLYPNLLSNKYQINDSIIRLIIFRSTLTIDSLYKLTKIEKPILGNLRFDNILLGIDLINEEDIIDGRVFVFDPYPIRKIKIISAKYGIRDSLCQNFILGCKIVINKAEKLDSKVLYTLTNSFLDSIWKKENIKKPILASILIDYFQLCLINELGQEIKDLKNNQKE